MAYLTSIIMFLAFATMFTGFVVQSFKLDWNGKPYDSVVDKLCAQFKRDRDIHIYMQGLTVDKRDLFYFVYRDHVYQYNIDLDVIKDKLWPNRPRKNYIHNTFHDPLVSLGKWDEIPWIETILHRNSIYGSLKLIRLRIYSIPEHDQKLEISFQRSSEAKVETLIATNKTNQVEFHNYLPDCWIFNTIEHSYYIFRYDNQGRVIMILRFYKDFKIRNQDPTEKGPFYLHVGQREDKSQIVSFYLNSPPSPYTPLLTQLPIYGWIPHGVVHLWDLANHRVLHFRDVIIYRKYETELGTYEFEKYFDCHEEKSPKLPIQEITKRPQVELSNLLLYLVFTILGLIVLLVASIIIVGIIVKRKRKQRNGNKTLLSTSSRSIKQGTSGSERSSSK